MRHWFFWTLFFLTFSLFGQSKYALVIGNEAYTNVSALRNPVNDANDIATTLQNLGFTVEKVLNANLGQMEGAVVRLKNRLSTTSNSYGFFFYAGHGVQSNGENYLIPVDANIVSESFLRTKALQVQPVLDELNQANNSLNVIVLDACRDNPFSWARSGTRGLTVVGGQRLGVSWCMRQVRDRLPPMEQAEMGFLQSSFSKISRPQIFQFEIFLT